MRILLLITMLLATLNAQNREALLIGNSNYKYISSLNDTSSNLSRLKTTLEGLGFSVKVKSNLTAKRLKEAIDNFSNRLARNRDTIGFLYYSGHGCQMDNVGYLIPTNVNSSKRLDVQYDALNINKMLATLNDAGNRVNMLFLDACRDNTPTGKKGGKKGLAQAPLTPKGTLVVYATEATKTADDNNNFINSLITQIKKPNKSIREIGFNISDDVASETHENQVPQVFAQRVPNMLLKREKSVKPVRQQQNRAVQAIKPVRQETRRVDSSTKSSKWITPSDSVCTNNGGGIADGVCKANWENASKICQESRSSLPTIVDLKQIVIDCGASVISWGEEDWNKLKNKNKINKSYQSCYERKNFNSGYYWSSTKSSYNHENVWFVNFYSGFNAYDNELNNYYVRCVRAGQ